MYAVEWEPGNRGMKSGMRPLCDVKDVSIRPFKWLTLNAERSGLVHSVATNKVNQPRIDDESHRPRRIVWHFEVEGPFGLNSLALCMSWCVVIKFHIVLDLRDGQQILWMLIFATTNNPHQ